MFFVLCLKQLRAAQGEMRDLTPIPRRVADISELYLVAHARAERDKREMRDLTQYPLTPYPCSHQSRNKKCPLLRAFVLVRIYSPGLGRLKTLALSRAPSKTHADQRQSD
jgi:hypothetical protein